MFYRFSIDDDGRVFHAAIIMWLFWCKDNKNLLTLHDFRKKITSMKHLVMCKKLVASVDRFDKVVPLTEFLGEDNLSGKPLLVRFVNRSLDVISF